MSNLTRRLIINLLAFQIGWFSCALGAAYGLPWLGVIIVMLIIALHLRQVAQPRLEGQLIIVTGLIGTLLDSVLMALGLLHFPVGVAVPWLIPPWLIAMWLLFAITLNGCLGWLKGRWGWAVLVGALGGLLAYGAGQRLGVVLWHQEPLYTAVALLLSWGGVLPLLMALAARWNGWARAQTDR